MEQTLRWGEGGGEGTQPRKDEVCFLYLLGVEKVVLVPHRVFSHKRSAVGVFAVPFRILSRKKILQEILKY